MNEQDKEERYARRPVSGQLRHDVATTKVQVAEEVVRETDDVIERHPTQRGVRRGLEQPRPVPAHRLPVVEQVPKVAGRVSTAHLLFLLSFSPRPRRIS